MKTVCIFLKSPRVGEAKRRLAHGVGATRASAIYRSLVEHQVAEIPIDWRANVYFTPPNVGEEMRMWLEPRLQSGTAFIPQCDGDLGQRLLAAARREFEGGSERVYLIGGDCPALSQDYFCEADSALNNHDVVLGPSEDGGYVLLGIKESHADLFRNIAWSTSAVLEQTLAAARRQTLSVRLLRPLVDIDDAPTFTDQAKIFAFLNLPSAPRTDAFDDGERQDGNTLG